MTARYAALARVSSREQEREGYSLDVQEEALRRYATRNGGEIVRLWRIAETASRNEERKTFRELLHYARQHKAQLAGVLFYKVDRAARNLFDYVELERLEADHGVPVVYVAQPTENSPAGRMQRRILANMATFYTEQQSLDVREGMQRRVESGWFAGKAPYGYRNVRINGRGVVEVDEAPAAVVRHVFEAYGTGMHTLDTLLDQLKAEDLYAHPGRRFNRSSVHRILTSRAYLGEVEYKGHWHAGRHAPLVDRDTFERVQARLGGHTYQAHDLLFGGKRLRCGHCGHPVTGERKTKQTRSGPRQYVYYRCGYYNSPGHPSERTSEQNIEAAVLREFRRLRVDDPGLAQWFRDMLRLRGARHAQHGAQRNAAARKELAALRRRTGELLDLRLDGLIDDGTFRAKNDTLQAQIRQAEQRIAQAPTASATPEIADRAIELFELSQTLPEQWLAADLPKKRRILDTVFLNCTLDGATLSATMRKPFGALAEGLGMQDGRGERI